MDERTFGMNKKHVWNPDFLNKARIESSTFVAAGGESQPIVLPVMPQVESHGEVLNKKKKIVKTQSA